MGSHPANPNEIRIRDRAWWQTMAIIAAFGAGIAIWLVVDIAADRQLADHGIVITATVKDIRPLRKSEECLASFTLDGLAYEQWSGDISHCKVGGQTTIILDHRDHRPLQSKDVYDRRWLSYGVQLLFVLISVWFSTRLYRWSKVML